MRHRVRQTTALLCALALLVLPGCSLAGRGQAQQQTEAQPEAAVNLVYYTIGTPDADLKLVNERLNELLAKKIGVTVDYVKIPWDDYEAQLSVLINSGKNCDVVFALRYSTDAENGAFLRLDDLLETTGSEMYAAIDPVFWEGVTLDGSIYGVPTNKELAVVEQWMFAKELVERYGIDIEAYGTLESLEPLFAMVHEQEPEYRVMELDRNANNFFALYGYEYLLDNHLPLMAHSTDKAPQIVNIFATPEGRRTLETLRRYYLAGYINEDAAVKPMSALEYGKKVFFRIASGGPYSDVVWSSERGYPLVASMKSAPVVTTESTRAGVMCVSATTTYPEECVKFLNCLNTDPEVRNLLNYGLEGVHYRLDDVGQVEFIARERYGGVQYTQGNWFILHTLAGEPQDKWQAYCEYNENAVKSTLLGFTPNFAGLRQELAAVTAVNDRYYASLMTGSVDTGRYLSEFNEALEQAGLGKIQEELQRQLDEWLAREV